MIVENSRTGNSHNEIFSLSDLNEFKASAESGAHNGYRYR